MTVRAMAPIDAMSAPLQSRSLLPDACWSLPLVLKVLRTTAGRSLIAASMGLAIALAITATIAGITPVSGQVRRKSEPAPPAEPLPAIANATAKCSFAYHGALSDLYRRDLNAAITFDKLARIPEPGMSGRWLFWNKSAKAAQAPQVARVCAESAVKQGRSRCVRWELKALDPALAAIASANPTSEELAALRALDSFVADKGAPLEFGSNGRQHVTLLRVASEIDSYSAQPAHPALCNGVPEMMEFKLARLAGLRKRLDDVAALSSKASTLAFKRVTAARDQRLAEAKALADAASADAGAEPVKPAATGAPLQPLALTAAQRTDLPALIEALAEGLVTPEQLASLKTQPTVLQTLQSARDLLIKDDAATSPATRASTAAALRMIEAANYGQQQAARMKVFEGLFFGSIERILSSHKAHCTCGS